MNIEQNVRLALGDLTLQLIAARAEIEELREQLALATPKDTDEAETPKEKKRHAPNGHAQPG